MEYDFRKIEKDWQGKWKSANAYRVNNDFAKPKYYVLDMFPYPSGTGLHVGHPLGYIASDIYSRYKRLKGFNVLHPMGFDSFGLPAEQYALETGQHPATTTKNNIATFKSQMDKIGFCYDWSREVQTSDPNYYKWTQWIFLHLFNSYFCHTQKKAIPIAELVKKYATKGAMPAKGDPISGKHFTAEQWNGFTEKEKEEILMKRRLAFSSYGDVNWCEALGTVLANDEVVNGVSERGGHPVEKRKMRQWYLRITEYADRLLEGLETVEFSDAMKEMQKNWIGKSEGAEIVFPLSISPRRGEEKEKTEAKMPEAKMPGFGYPSYNVDSTMSFEYAKTMRKQPTETEKIVWDALRNRGINYKFRRQHPIENYIVDFVCLDVWLIVEVDGGYHTGSEQKEADTLRDADLNELGFTTLRFTNEEVIGKLDHVLKSIKDKADDLKLSSVEKRTNVGPPLSQVGRGGGEGLKVYTTRPDTIFGVDFMVLAPEHELVAQITTAEQKNEIDKYLSYVKSRSERERLAEAKTITGCFTGAYAINPFDGREIPVWIAEYVLAGYGTGAIMAVPCGDQRDFAFANHFNIPITNIIGKYYSGEEANATKEAILQNSGFLNGLLMKDAIGVAVDKIEELGIGKRKVNYKMRDAGFSRQRYWGEPFPIVWKNGTAYPLAESELPLELPHVDSYQPGPNGQGPLANIPEWVAKELETSTMPGYAGSSWYFLRYMDPNNKETFCDRKISDYWNQVDLYIGGTEHAVGHLLYSRMWTKVLYDLDLIGFDEPYRKLLNQGMITGVSQLIYRYTPDENEDSVFMGDKIPYSDINISMLVSLENDDAAAIMAKGILPQFYFSIDAIPKGKENEFIPLHVNIKHVSNSQLNVEELLNEDNRFNKKELFRCKEGFYLRGKWFDNKTNPSTPSFFKTSPAPEKMSKRYLNVVNPNDLCEKYGADTFRMYEMFLGPVEASKPWDTKGIEGVHRFLRKLWRLFYDDIKGKVWNEEKANDAELKILHRTIKKIEEDTERFSFNTAVSTFMIAVNELADIKCYKKEILEPLLILLAPYAPHISEELYNLLESSKVSPLGGDLEGAGSSQVPSLGGDLGEAGAGGRGSVLDASFPIYDPKYLVESSKEYPISINGKLRTNISMALDLDQKQVEEIVLQNDIVQKWLEGKAPKKIIFVKNKMINVVI